ncbi:MAG: EAL domain-containing protein [Sphingomonadaceae bacterium]|nr:EAL domain-containing protein [Sphingomonadaceae bacterium]
MSVLKLPKALSGYRIAMLFSAVISALAGTLWMIDGGIENSLRSARDTIRNQPASGEFVIVEIDAQSLAEIDTWPWPRRIHGQMVDRLNEADVETIAFDVDFSSHSTPNEDLAFAEALQRSNAVVLLPAFRQYAGAGDTRYIDSEPIEELREGAFLASVNINAGSDGQVRRALLGVETNGLPRPSLAAMLANVHGEADISFPIDYAIDPGTIPRFSYAEILSGSADLSELSGKSVIIGATAIEMGDRYAVPRHGIIPGVVVQALGAETLVEDGVPAEHGPALALSLAALGVLIMFCSGSHLLRAVGAAAVMVIIFTFPILTEQWFNASYKIVPGLMMLIATGLTGVSAMVLRKYRRTQLTDRETGLRNRTALLLSARRKDEIAIIAGHVERFAEIAALLSAEELKAFFAEIARRLSVASGGQAIYRIDDTLIAWRAAELSHEDIGEHLEGVAALFRSPIEIGSQRIDANLFFGVAEGSGRDIRSLTVGAALAAARAMASGLCWDRHVEGDGANNKWHLSLLGELDDAMDNGALWVAFQPKFTIENRTVVSAEALVRWNHPERGPIPPDSFIPTVEKRGRMADLTLFVTARALAAVLRWQSSGLDCGVAVNVSANLLDDPAFLSRFAETVDSSGIDPAKLTVEVTESSAFENPDRAIRGMEELRTMGIRLSIDDYGTGQSTLSYLKRLPVQELKIDKSFVQSIESSQSDNILVRSTIELAHDLGLSVVAEGIETESCLEMLRGLGCDTGQGYLVGKPMAVGEFERVAMKELEPQGQLAA